MEDTARIFADDEVTCGPNPGYNEHWDGYLKSDGSAVRHCEGGHWKLLEEFPPKKVHWATWICYYCHDIPKPPPKKVKKGEKFSQYNEYVIKCIGFKSELASLRSEYTAQLYRLKMEENVVRGEYANRRKEVLARKKEHEDEYREKISTKI